MKIIIANDYEDMSRKAANYLSAQVIMKPDAVLGLATGETPIGAYKQLVEWYNKGDIDFSQTSTINLDEYKGLTGDHKQSYRYFMDTNLFDLINIKNKDNYKDFTGVEAAVNAVTRGKNITEQTEVDAMAKAIEDAIAALQYKDADYTKVDAAIAKANALNKNDYKDFSGVETAVKAVVRGKNITEQSEVDKMAKAIEDAIAALEKKPASTKPGTSDKSPQTGDSSNLVLWISLLFASGGAAIGTTVVSRKKKYNR